MTDLSEQIITAAMTGTIDHDTADKLLDIHLRVIRQISCPITSHILDTRTAHLLTAANTNNQTGSIAIHPATPDPEIASRLADNHLTFIERYNPAPAWTQLTERTPTP